MNYVMPIVPRCESHQAANFDYLREPSPLFITISPPTHYHNTTSSQPLHSRPANLPRTLSDQRKCHQTRRSPFPMEDTAEIQVLTEGFRASNSPQSVRQTFRRIPELLPSAAYQRMLRPRTRMDGFFLIFSCSTRCSATDVCPSSIFSLPLILIYRQLSYPISCGFHAARPASLFRNTPVMSMAPPTGIKGDRKVVMDKTLLPKDEMKEGFRKFNGKDLLERFLSTLRSEVQAAAQNKQPVLVLIFGHGLFGNSSVFMGCGLGGSWLMSEDHLASVLQKAVQTTLILTSCYSGGWVMKPNKNQHFDLKPKFNYTILTAAGIKKESLSWPEIQTAGRQAGGSVFATCLLNSIVAVSENSSTEKLVKNDEGTESSTMVALTQGIVEECKRLQPSIWQKHEFSCAIQDDLWAQFWGKRTGLPLSDYRTRWESLPEALHSQILYPPGSPQTACLGTGSMSRSPQALNNIVRFKAARYMALNPGPNNLGGNTSCHPLFRDLIEGADFELSELYILNEVLDYRKYQTELAEYYCYTMGLKVHAERQVDEFDPDWEDFRYKAKYEGSADESKVAVELLGRFNTIHSWVCELCLFDLPLPEQGLFYSKPLKYLAAMLADRSIPLPQIQVKLQGLLHGTYILPNTYFGRFLTCIIAKLSDAKRVACSPLGVTVLQNPDIKSKRRQLYETVDRLKHRISSSR